MSGFEMFFGILQVELMPLIVLLPVCLLLDFLLKHIIKDEIKQSVIRKWLFVIGYVFNLVGLTVWNLLATIFMAAAYSNETNGAGVELFSFISFVMYILITGIMSVIPLWFLPYQDNNAKMKRLMKYAGGYMLILGIGISGFMLLN